MHNQAIHLSVLLEEQETNNEKKKKNTQTYISAMFFSCQLSIIYLILDLIYWMVTIFIFGANHQFFPG